MKDDALRDDGFDEEVVAALFRPRGVDRRAPVACPDPELVQASQAGTLPDDLQSAVASHVVHCAMCQALRDALDDPSVVPLTAAERERLWTRLEKRVGRPTSAVALPRWSAAAAVAALAILSAVLFWSGTSEQRVPTHVSGLNESVLELEKAPLPMRGSNELIWRGSDGSAAAAELDSALKPYLEGDYVEAVRRLHALVTRYPGSRSGHFYLGVSKLFVGENREAIAALQSAEKLASSDAELTEATSWYLALAYHQAGQKDLAYGKLADLCQHGGSRAARACAALGARSSRPTPPSK